MAKAHQDTNYLGLEIRRPVTAIAISRAAALGLRNLHYICCNANVDLDTVLTEAIEQGGIVNTISIQFPDPCFKVKHHKRRILQPQLVSTIEKHLQPGGTLFMQSDVFHVLEEMRHLVRDTAVQLVDSHGSTDDWMEGEDNNPMGIATEREIATYRNGGSVYRCVFHKQAA
ncbi:unnamed protein product [Discosporangium mesarthrocarpum]